MMTENLYWFYRKRVIINWSCIDMGRLKEVWIYLIPPCDADQEKNTVFFNRAFSVIPCYPNLYLQLSCCYQYEYIKQYGALVWVSICSYLPILAKSIWRERNTACIHSLRVESTPQIQRRIRYSNPFANLLLCCSGWSSKVVTCIRFQRENYATACLYFLMI